MKIFLVHNYYQHGGGEDEVFRTDAGLLEEHGHDVRRYCLHNDSIDGLSYFRVARQTVWNSNSYSELRTLFRTENPDIAHFHNTFPLISPSSYYAAAAAGVPVVQTLHNFRLLCPNALLFRDGHVCGDCVGRTVAWPAVVHKCYRESRPASAVTSGMLAAHRVMGTWSHMVAAYITLTEFARQRFIEGGLPAERLLVKPNTLRCDPGQGDHRGGFGLFVGRLSAEKGLDVLLDAWMQLRQPLRLLIVGSGPLEHLVRQAGPYVTWLGRQPTEQVFALMRDASFLVFPSKVYEGFPMTLLEALATGLPALASGHGSIAEVIRDGVTGRHVRPGDHRDLAAKVEWAIANPRELAAMGRRGRDEYLSRYTAEQNYLELAAVYKTARAGTAPGATTSTARRIFSNAAARTRSGVFADRF